MLTSIRDHFLSGLAQILLKEEMIINLVHSKHNPKYQ